MIKNILITIIILSFVLSLENYGQNRSKKILEKEKTHTINKSKRETSVVREQNEPNRLMSLINNALELYKKKKYEEAIPIFREAILLAAVSDDLEKGNKSNLEVRLVVGTNNMALSLNDMGRYAEAEPLMKEALAICRRLYRGEDHPNLAMSINNMAFLLNNMGRNTEAEPLYKEALEIKRRLYKEKDHPDLALSINNMAMLLSDMGRYTEGEAFLREALDMYRRIYKGKDYPELSSCINNMALLLYNMGRYTEAEPLYKEALEMSRRIYKNEDHPELARSINNMAMLLSDLGRYTEAEPLYIEALDLYRRIYQGGDHPYLVKSVNNMASLLSDMGRNTEAEPLYKEALEMSQRIYKNEDHPELGLSINNLAFLLNNMGRYTEAEPLYKEALEMNRRIHKGEDHPDLATCINNLALLLNNMGRYTEAEPLYKEALEIKRRLYKEKDHPDLALSINNMAMLLSDMGRYTEGEAFLREALDMYRRIYKGKDHPDLATCINNLALLLNNMGRYTEAEPLYKEALEIKRRLYKEKDHPDLALSINNMAMLLSDMGRYTKGEAFLREALDMYRRTYKGKDHPELSSCINNMGFLLKSMGRYTEAESLYKEALEMSRRIYKNEDHPELARSLNNIAELIRTMGRYTEAEPFHKEALEMSRRIYKNKDHPELASCINNMGFLLNEMGRNTEAEKLYKEALEMSRRIYKNEDHPDLALRINNMGFLLYDMGRKTEAEKLLKESLQMRRTIYQEKDHHALATSLLNMSAFYSDQKKYEESMVYFSEGLDVLKRMLKNNFTYMSEREKEQYLATFEYYFEIFNSLICDNREVEGYTKELYNNRLLLKGIIGASISNLRKKVEGKKNGELLAKYDNYTGKRKIYAKMLGNTSDREEKKKIDIKQLSQEINQLEKELGLELVEVFEEVRGKEITWEDVRKTLKDNEAAVEIVRFRYHTDHWTDTVYYAALILTEETKDHPELVLLENGNELEGSLFKEYQDYIATSQYHEKGEDVSDEGKLYDSFWGKIAEKIKGKTRVYLSSDGVYNQINLNSLYNPMTKKYVIDETEIVLLTSTRELALEKKERKYENTAEMFGFPNYDLGAQEQKEIAQDYDLKRKRLLEGARLTELPGTKIEIEESGNILQKNKWVVNEYLGDNALEENLKKINSPRLLHIATHGVFLGEEQIEREKNFSLGIMGDQQKIYYDNPLLRSALFFSGANRSRKGINVGGVEDGVFTGYEAQNLYLMNTELVILSACETGLGVIKSGEGVYGLQRALRVAGAENIIMSLWKVSDEATKDLILSFYAKWTSGKSVKEAFREAQRELRAKYPGAYYWAAFVLISG